MHASLTTAGNVTTQALAGAAAAVALLALNPVRAEICLLTVALGALAGWLQSQAIRRSAQGFRSASSQAAVRGLLKASLQGQWSIGLAWLNGLLVMALLVAGAINFDSAIAAYAAFLLSREMICFPAIRALNAEAR